MGREPPLAEDGGSPALRFSLRYLPEDRSEVAGIRATILEAEPRVSRWGAFRRAVTIRILPDHEALEAAVGRHGYPWLRAWAFGDQILLQSPRTWDRGRPLQELLVHELTHALMYQLLQPDDVPFGEEPPPWFREGMASVTAGQEQLGLTELRQFRDQHPGADLLRPSGELYRTEKEAVYGAAHRAFELLVELCGERAVRDVLRGVRSGARFADAFAMATGYALETFEAKAVSSGFSATAFQGPVPATGAGGP